MTTNPTMMSINHSQTWKLVSVLLALALAGLLVGIGVESYYLYRSYHHRDAIVAHPGLAPSIPQPGAPTLNSVRSPADDWGLPSPTFETGNPWNQLNHLHQQMDQLFNDTFSQFPLDNPALLSAVSSPNLDIREEKDHYLVRADMPGADKGTIQVNVDGRLLTISGERTSVNETKDRDKVVRSERSMAQFVRSVELPGPVKAESVDAKYDNGVLTLNLPKSDRATAGTQVPIH